MRRLSLQGARWHKHGIYRTCVNHASHTPPILRAFSSRRHAKEQPPPKQDVTVRYWQQTTPRSKDRKEIDIEADEQADEEALKAKVAELERELEEMKEGPFGPNSEFMQSLSEEDRNKAMEAWRKYQEEHREEDEAEEAAAAEEEARLDAEIDDLVKRDFNKVAEEQRVLWDPNEKIEEPLPPPKLPFEVELKVPDTHEAYVSRFNKTLKVLHRNPSLAQRQDAWRSYRRCKETLSFFLDIIPEEGLALLWQSQIPRSEAERQVCHWEALAKDILSSGRELSTSQWLQYIDLLCQHDKVPEATSLWEERAPTLENYTPEEVAEFLRLGVQLHVAAGKPKRAQDIAKTLLAGDEAQDPRILIPVIGCWARSGTEKDKGRAWTVYLRLKTMLRDTITMEDYDSISVDLLKAGRVDLALAVFKDMMLTGQSSPSESIALYKVSLGLVGKLQASSIDESEVNKISLAAITILPRKFQNKYFYASWMKKLIGMGEIDSAAAVVELMYERGVKPDAKHLNGVLAGWFREGSRAAKDKAEKLGWAMIQERIDQVWRGKPEAPSIHRGGIPIPEFVRRTVPPASLETFSVLLLYYTRRDQTNVVNHLVDCLEQAHIRPNSFFMNHLLYAELRQHNIADLWSKYKVMTETVKPDLETFACLWDCAKIQYDRTRYHYDYRFPHVRSLCKEMISWFTSLSPHQQKTAREQFSKDLYDQITRCLCLSLDPEATLVALRSMKELFSMSPDPDTSRILTFLIVRLAPVPVLPGAASGPKPRRRRISTTPRAKENFDNISKLLQILRDRRIVLLGRKGENVEDLDETGRGSFELDALCDLLRVVMKKTKNGDAEKVEKSIQRAADEMGVPDLDIGEKVDLEI